MLRVFIAALTILLSTGAAQATVIERSVVIDLETDGRIKFSEPQSWEGIVGIDEFSFSTGDQLRLSIRFANEQQLELTDLGLFENRGVGENVELTKLWLGFKAPGSLIRWRSAGTYTYTGVSGELLSNPTSFGNTGSGGAFAFFSHENLTNSSFAYRGVDLVIDIASWELREGSGVFDRFEWSSAADQVRIGEWSPVPEPATILLLALGLAGLGFTRRRLH